MSKSVVTVNQGELKFVSESVSSCNICDKTFFDKNELDWHIRKRHTMRVGWPALPFICDLCGAEYVGGSELKDHIEGHHGSTLKPTGEKGNEKHETEVGETEVMDDNST